MGHGSGIDHITSLSGEYFWRKLAVVQRNAMLFIRTNISMGWCKKDVTPSLVHWSYVFLALAHRFTLGTDSSIQ